MSNTTHWIEILVCYIDLQAGVDCVHKAGEKIIFPKKSLGQNGFRTPFLDTMRK